MSELSDISIRQALQLPLEDVIGNTSGKIGLWYDWFCADKALPNRGKVSVTRLKQIIDSPKINIDTMYVFFKNNCPVFNKLYDDFRICDLKSGNVIFTVIPKNNDNESEIWGRENGFKEPLFVGSWTDAKKWFNPQ